MAAVFFEGWPLFLFRGVAFFFVQGMSAYKVIQVRRQTSLDRQNVSDLRAFSDFYLACSLNWKI